MTTVLKMELPKASTGNQTHPPPSREDVREDEHNRSDNTDLSENDLLYFNEHMDPKTADFLRLLILEGRNRPGDCGVLPDKKPYWLDDESIKLGQQFAMKYYFGVIFADVVAIFLLFALPKFMEPLIFSGNSVMPVKAFQRYLSMLLRVNTWYNDDLWAEGSKARHNLSVVRGMHDRMRRDLRRTPPDEMAQRTRLKMAPWAEGAADALREDLAPDSAALRESFCPLARAIGNGQRINQLEMSITQFIFVGLQVTFPEHVGTSGASEEELEGFVHLWRALGHLLGVEERFNFCSGGLHAVRRRTKAVLEVLLRPSLARMDDTWEHMTRTLVSSLLFFVPGVAYEVLLVQLLATAGAAPPLRLMKGLSSLQRLQCRLLAWVLRWTPRVAPLRSRVNRWLLARMHRAFARTNDAQWLDANDRRVGYVSYQERMLRGNKINEKSNMHLVTAVFIIALIVVAVIVT